MLNAQKSKGFAAGFTLVELMVGLAVGLILSAAAVALVISVLRANADSIASVKLNQEGRAIGDVIHRELKRARFSGGYLSFVGQGGSPANPFAAITDQAGSSTVANDPCVKFSYDADDDGTLDANEVKSFFLDGGAVYFSQADTYANARCSTGTGAMRISSPDVFVSSLSFDQTYRAGSPPTGSKNEIVVDYQLELTRVAGDDTGITRDFSQTIHLRNPILN